MQTPGIKNRLNWWISILLTAVIAFAGGMITCKYELFPYDQIKWLKNHLVGSRPNGNHAGANRHSTYYYPNKKSFFEVNGVAADIVMIGDSITDEAEWHELFPKQLIVNRGIRGDTTKGVLNRMDSILSTRAKKAFIMLGHNDLRQNETVENVYLNYEKIVARLKSNGIMPYIQSTLLAGQQHRALNKKIRALNSQLEALCRKEGLVYIDLNRKLAKDRGLNPSLSQDDVHLNGKGYSIWKNQIKKYVE
jgi:lysophospholipase L1-like esterase